MGVTHFLLLSTLCLAITAQECEKPQPGPNMQLRGDDILLETFANGSSVSFDCDVGYTSAGGSSTIVCTNGKWSTIKLRCKKRNCGATDEVINGNVDYLEGTEYGAILKVVCNPGFQPVGGSKEIRCEAQGWTGRLPSCEAVVCEPPPPVVGGSFNPVKDMYSYRDAITYSCQRDYTLVGAKTISCSDEGILTPNPPQCVATVECEEPVIKNAIWSGGARPPYKYKSLVTYKCNTGFIMEGEGSLTCQIDGKWSPAFPTCKVIPTTTKATTTTTTTASTTSTATTTTTTRPTTQSKKPTDRLHPTDKPTEPGNRGNTVGIVVGVLVIVVLALGAGGYLFYRKKKSSHENYPDNVPTKDGEDLPLS
ncbi:membrane cofactor protein-like isoform X2 [Seriola lalandi dorsalis]|uniref:Membrane cofactor protein-like n=2 Tax=Seriola lalandi dorsalis TaxID=1841481 RepID=A0A3B4XRN3_SERLL|nr:membrane cofactor protein-like isoform X2 [Seriola lalandi dorsalis]